MTLEPFERVLIDGGRRQLLEFGSCEHCVVVDWRDDVEAILEALAPKLPGGYLTYRRVDDQRWELQCHGTVHTLVASDFSDKEPLLSAINRALLPDYEMRIFTPTVGDGYSLLVRPAKWWADFSAEHALRAGKLFVTTDERAEVTGTVPPSGTRPKSWWRKVFGRSGG